MHQTFLLAFLMAAIAAAPVIAGDEITRGAERPDAKGTSKYNATWALIIGIDYNYDKDDPVAPDEYTQREYAKVVPRLKNAGNDARKLAGVLRNYYSEPGYGYDAEHLHLLTGKDATDENIAKELHWLSENATENDSVLIFFAGHAARLDSHSTGNSVALLPRNVTIQRGKVIGNMVKLPGELFNQVQSTIKAKHMLLILDCCYSGEIFELPDSTQKFKRRVSEASDRGDEALRNQRAIQALASCRSTELAADGEGSNSPFSDALINGLQRLPALTPDLRRVWANRLLYYIRFNFRGKQKPDCRNLTGTDGEFCFYPAPNASFSKFMVSLSEQQLIQASVASRQGNWWFKEMPWFLPSIREAILQPTAQTRSSTVSEAIELTDLEKLTQRFIDASGGGKMEEMRRSHARRLVESAEKGSLSESLEVIRAELEAKQKELTTDEAGLRTATQPAGAGDTFEPYDLHTLAIVQHSLDDNEAAVATYKAAIQAYDNSKKESPLLRILKALCYADYAELLFANTENSKAAARQFQLARTAMRKVTGPGEPNAMQQPGGGSEAATEPAVTAANQVPDNATGIFEVQTLCREADCWIKLNQWNRADSCLLEALDRARILAPDHYLTAHVHRRRAWAEMNRWRIGEAILSFQESNSIIKKLLAAHSGVQANSTQITAEDAPAKAAASSLTVPALQIHDGFDAEFRLPAEYEASGDYSSKIAYLHNLHGLAMAKRYQGKPAEAARSYRQLVDLVESTYSRFRGNEINVTLENQLVGRIINTQERLGDCSLFSGPKRRDINESLDDYRRAVHRVHLLKNKKIRERIHAALLFKQALAYAVKSPFQDTELAVQMSERASGIFKKHAVPGAGLYRALSLLAPPVVEVMHASKSAENNLTTAEDKLRSVLHDYRDTIGAAPHRDEFELSLFAAQILLESSGERTRLQKSEDADLLLSFCRIGQAPYQSQYQLNFRIQHETADSRAYLRPYYNSVLRAKLQDSSQNVRELLEIQHEATGGRYYVKQPIPMPLMAIYTLDDDCYLFFDAPRTSSACIKLSETYDVKDIQQACYATRLPLPRSVSNSLKQWWGKNLELVSVENRNRWEASCCRWQDSVLDLRPRRVTLHAGAQQNGGKSTSAGAFPFDLSDIAPARTAPACPPEIPAGNLAADKKGEKTE